MNIVPTKRWAVVVAATLLGAALTACAGPGAGAGGGVHVVASTDVWGDVVGQVAGARAGHGVSITSIIDDPGVDPHSYEANGRTQLAVARADILVENGGGYDDFMGRLRTASKSSARLLDAVRLSGHRAPAGGELNEHVWYDLAGVRRVTDAIARALAAQDPAHAATYRANAARFADRLAGLQATEASIRRAHAGAGVAITEPVPLYLLTACGLVNRTPAAFSEAVEEGDDVPAELLARTLRLFSAHRVALLAYNEQTTGVPTQRVLAQAKADGVAVVGVTETLPAGRSYLSWMADNLQAVRRALG